MTAPRPNTLGDPFPSDLGDVPPAVPTDSFVERNYRLPKILRRSIPARPDVKGSPDMRVAPKKTPKQTTFTGLILRRDKQNRYQVLRQDGRTGVAFTRGDEDVFDEYRIGDPVTLTADEYPGQFTIVGNRKRKELQLLGLSNNGEVRSQNETRIELSVIMESEGDECFRMEDGGIRILKDTECQYEISAVVILGFDDTVAASSSLHVGNECISYGTGLPLPTVTNANTGTLIGRLQVNRNTGLTINTHTAIGGKVTATLTIEGPPVGYMLTPFSTTAGGHNGPAARWTDATKLGNSLTIGHGNTDGGWLFLIGTSEVSGAQLCNAWLSAGKFNDDHGHVGPEFANCRIIFPGVSSGSTGWGVGSHMFVAKKDGSFGNSAKLEFTQPGFSGYVDITYESTLLGRLTFDQGICIMASDSMTTAPYTSELLRAYPSYSTSFVTAFAPQKFWSCPASG